MIARELGTAWKHLKCIYMNKYERSDAAAENGQRGGQKGQKLNNSNHSKFSQDVLRFLGGVAMLPEI